MMIPDEEFHEFSKAPPDPVMDSPEVSSFWRRRAALMLGLHDPNAPWVDIIGLVESKEYRRDRAFADGLALRHLRLELERRDALPCGYELLWFGPEGDGKYTCTLPAVVGPHSLHKDGQVTFDDDGEVICLCQEAPWACRLHSEAQS